MRLFMHSFAALLSKHFLVKCRDILTVMLCLGIWNLINHLNSYFYVKHSWDTLIIFGIYQTETSKLSQTT